MRYWQHWKYKNITLVFLSLIFTLVLSVIPAFKLFLLNLGNMGYFGAFLAGILFVSTFTVTTGALILIILSGHLNPFEIGIIAGLGAVIGDLTIFQIIKDGLTGELKQIYDKIDHRHHIIKLLHTRYFHWSLPVVGALIIASPLPDEMGITLLGISKMKTYQFIPISFILNSLGIFLTVSTSALLINK